MIDTILLRLLDRLTSFTAEDAYAACNARTPADREAVDAALDRLVETGQLRREGRRHHPPRREP